jgi:ankyrin repeat protein
MSAVVLGLSLLSSLGLLQSLDPFDWRHGLYASARSGNAERVRLFLTIRPDLIDAHETRTKLQETPLQAATDCNHLAVMKVVIDRGADVNATGSAWATPLQLAAYHGHRDAAELLLKHGATLDLYSAVALNKRDEVERLFVVANVFGLAKPLANSQIAEGRLHDTPLLCVARAKGHEEMAKLLLRNGADPDAKVTTRPTFISDRNFSGPTIGLTPAGVPTAELDVPVRPAPEDIFTTIPSDLVAEAEALLRFADMLGALPCSGYLLPIADVNCRTAFLECAIRNSRAEMVAMLVRHGARVNPPSARMFGPLGPTPLELAIQFSDLNTVEVLLTAGADVHGPTSQGITPMTLAFARGRRDVGRLLQRYHAVPLGSTDTPTPVRFRSFSGAREDDERADTNQRRAPVRPRAGIIREEPW